MSEELVFGGGADYEIRVIKTDEMSARIEYEHLNGEEVEDIGVLDLALLANGRMP